MSRKSKEKASLGQATALPSGTAGLSNRWMVPGICIFLAAIVWAVFGRTLGYEFVNYDDNLYVYENPAVQEGLTLKSIASAFSYVHTDNWVPLTTISHILDCQFYGLNAGGHHLTNILLQTATAILLFLVLRQMTGALWRSAFVAAVFAIHPLRVESVAWVTERKDVLSGVFFMLTISAYVRYARHPWSSARYGLVLLLFALGLMSKPTVVTIPFVLLLLDYWPLKRFTSSAAAIAGTGIVCRLENCSVPLRLIVEKIPMLMLSIASCIPTVLAERIGILSVEKVPLGLRIENALVSYAVQMGRMLYPAKLALLYPYPANGLPLWKIIPACLLLAAISLGVLFWRRKHAYLLVGWLWYLGMLVPMIGLVQVGSQAQADRHTYLPQIGLYLLLTWAAADLCAGRRYGRWILGGLSTFILAALIYCAWVQTAYWRNSESLWTHTLACTSDNVGAHYNLGDALLKKGNADEAIVHYQQALQINPDDEEVRYNLGTVLFQKGRMDEAIVQYQKALQIKPDFTKARLNLGNTLLQKGKLDEAITHFQKVLEIKPDYAEAQNSLGYALFLKGQVDEAISHYQKALQINPDYAEAHYNLGYALLQKGRVDEAIAHYQQALEIKPDYAEAHLNLGDALLQNGSVDKAIIHFQKALQIKPDDLEVQNNLAWVLATAQQASLRNGPRAVELAQRANQLAGGENLIILHTLAAAYAEAGRFDDARQSIGKALELARAEGRQDMVKQLNVELNLYEAGLPFHLESK